MAQTVSARSRDDVFRYVRVNPIVLYQTRKVVRKVPELDRMTPDRGISLFDTNDREGETIFGGAREFG